MNVFVTEMMSPGLGEYLVYFNTLLNQGISFTPKGL